MVRVGRIMILIGLLIVALGVAQFALAISLTTEFGKALATEFGWVQGNDQSHNLYSGYALPMLVFACVIGGIIARAGMITSRSKFSRWV